MWVKSGSTTEGKGQTRGKRERGGAILSCYESDLLSPHFKPPACTDGTGGGGAMWDVVHA
jgi:hypothetical protein